MVNNLEELVKFVKAEIEYLEKESDGMYAEYFRGKLRAYREILAELKRV